MYLNLHWYTYHRHVHRLRKMLRAVLGICMYSVVYRRSTWAKERVTRATQIQITDVFPHYVIRHVRREYGRLSDHRYHRRVYPLWSFKVIMEAVPAKKHCDRNRQVQLQRRNELLKKGIEARLVLVSSNIDLTLRYPCGLQIKLACRSSSPLLSLQRVIDLTLRYLTLRYPCDL